MQRTRRELLSLLKRRGRATLEELASDVGLAQITVRTHLNHLKTEGLVQAYEERGRVGRPFFVYSLTPVAEDVFPKQYDRLAASMLDGVLLVCGRERVSRLCREVAEDLAQRYTSNLEQGTSLEERVRSLTDLLNKEGAFAEWRHEQESGAYVIRKFNCPFSCMSHEHPELCTIDLHVMRRLFDSREIQADVKIEHAQCARCDQGRCEYRITPRNQTAGDR